MWWEIAGMLRQGQAGWVIRVEKTCDEHLTLWHDVIWIAQKEDMSHELHQKKRKQRYAPKKDNKYMSCTKKR